MLVDVALDVSIMAIAMSPDCYALWSIDNTEFLQPEHFAGEGAQYRAMPHDVGRRWSLLDDVLDNVWQYWAMSVGVGRGRPTFDNGGR